MPEMRHAPPAMVLTTIMLGGFRGLLADILWLRASNLQEDGQYVELIQLSDWITRLDPRNVEVWQFHAWNLAYNISVMMTDPEDRWRWVQSGIRLLRDEGLLYNPGAAGICQTIGWLYQHKIGAALDTAHLFYKQRLAAEMTALFGSGYPDYSAIQADPTRSRSMATRYGLVVDIMRTLESEVGALDWRLPETHAIYWAYRGLPAARGNDLVLCHRMILQCLSELFRSGMLTFDTASGSYERAPDVTRLQAALRRYDLVISQYPFESFQAGRRTLITDAARILHKAGREKEARQYFEDSNNLLPPMYRFESYEVFLNSSPHAYFAEPGHTGHDQ